MAETVQSGRHVRYTSESNTEPYPGGVVISVTRPNTSALRRRENTRARLLEAALGVFAEKGLKRVTVDDLVGAAGFTRGAFYSNFASIEEVFFAVFEDQSRRMMRTVRETIDAIPAGDFSPASMGLILDSLMPFGRTWFLIQSEFTLLALRNEEAREVFADHHRRFEREMEELIGDIIARLDREPTIPIQKLTETAIALYLHSIAHENLGTGALGTADLVDIVLPQVLIGLSRPVG
jgi:AcrR family transcriptional regulator